MAFNDGDRRVTFVVKVEPIAGRDGVSRRWQKFGFLEDRAIVVQCAVLNASDSWFA